MSLNKSMDFASEDFFIFLSIYLHCKYLCICISIYHFTLSLYILKCLHCKPKTNKKDFSVFSQYRPATHLSIQMSYKSSARINRTAFLRRYFNPHLDLPVATIYPEELCNTGLCEVNYNSLLPAVLVLGGLVLV